MRTIRKIYGAAAAILISAGIAVAHDFWIEVSDFTPQPGQAIDARLFVGDHFEGKAYARKFEHLARFWVAESGSEPAREIGGEVGADPAGRFVVEKPGVHVVAYRSTRTLIELDAEKFESYLRDEGLESIIKRRAERGESDQPGREAYSRCAKAILRCSDGPSVGFDRVMGLPLELVPVTDPFAMRGAGEKFRVKLLYEGKPLGDAMIQAMHRESEGSALTTIDARTDSQGVAEFDLSKPGLWLLASTHMFEAGDDVEADWESLWASLTFELEKGV